MPSPTTTEATTLLSHLYAQKSSWASLTGFKPSSVGDEDINFRKRYLVLLAIHASNHPHDDEESLISYLLDQEILYHQKIDRYRSSLSLAAYLTSTRIREPRSLWGIWVARETNFDASKCVDTHYMYYAAGSLDAAKSYVQNCSDIMEAMGTGEGRESWWSWVIENNGGDLVKALEDVKNDVCARIEHDRKYGVTDDAVRAFVETSWRRDTQEWAGSLLPEETWCV